MTDHQQGRHQGRAFVHHVELWMDDLAAAEREWGPVLLALGCVLHQNWENGRSWLRDGSYLVIERSPALRPGGHDRLRAGINHLAVRGERGPVRAAALASGWSERVDTGRALHLTDGQGFELEVVYSDDEGDDPSVASA